MSSVITSHCLHVSKACESYSITKLHNIPSKIPPFCNFSDSYLVMMRGQINVSAPSKVILHGEHAVVYGKSAIAASVDLRTKMCLVPLQDHVLQVDFPDVQVKRQWKSKDIKENILHKRPKNLNGLDHDFLKCIEDFLNSQEDQGTTTSTISISAAAASDTNTIDSSTQNEFQRASLTCFFYLYALLCDKFVPLQIKVESEIPLGAGLGSSAALSVCLAAGLSALKFSKKELVLEEICQYAFISEQILHGRPSGIDNAVSTYGGFVHFKNSKITPIECSNNVNGGKSDLRILLVNTKIPRSTKTMVQGVNELNNEYPDVVGPTLEAIDGVSNKCLEILQADDSTNDRFRTIQNLIQYNQKLLEALGVSHPALEEVILIAKSFGLSAKLTGAGGGGFALIILPPSLDENKLKNLKERLVKKHFDCYETNIGVDGVRIHVDNDVVCISQ